MDIPRQVRVVLASVFVASLAAILLAGLIWAYNPVGNGGLQFLPDTVPRDGGAAAGVEPEPAAAADEGDAGEGEEEPEPSPTPSPTPTPTEDPTELMEAAADPAETSVQVLDAGGGAAATREAAAVLRDLGYRVVNVTSSRTDVDVTTVWYTDGKEPEALALRARNERFANVGPNQRLNEGTDLHALVGGDWD